MNPVYDFGGQFALATGAAKGMGLATARMFSQSGAAVVVADLEGDRTEVESTRIVREGGHAIAIACDVSRVEHAPRGIHINAVCPVTIDTPMVADILKGQGKAMEAIMRDQSIGRLDHADEIAAAVLWLCSPGARFVIGVDLPVDGGFTAH